MIREIHTVREAAQEWVREFDAIPTDMIAELMRNRPYDWQEITEPCKGDRVYIYCELPSNSCEGEIVEYEDEDFIVGLDDGTQVTVSRDDMEVEYDDGLPMWGTMWSFKDPCDMHWVEEDDGIEALSKCGFRVYRSEDYGIFFGIDGAGYDFYDDHWCPLYKIRGLQWHEGEE